MRRRFKGAVWLLCLSLSGVGCADANVIAITVDDLPAVDEHLAIADIRRNTSHILDAMKRHGVTATGFVNEDKLAVPGEVDARVDLLRSWSDAGMDLGNHGFGHLAFQKTPLDRYEEAVMNGETITRRLLEERHRSLVYYRYPYNQTGPTLEIRDQFLQFLAVHQYKVAPFTIEDDDSIFAAVYADALVRGDRALADRVRRAYMVNLELALRTFESMSQSLFGRQINQVLLIHANKLNADTLSLTLNHLERRGYHFVALEQALRDPAYASPDGYVGPYGPSWLRRWADGMKRDLPVRGQPDPQDWIQSASMRLLVNALTTPRSGPVASRCRARVPSRLVARMRDR
jgi:peptidoglycan-N-acetylglucosamine deacetylase